MTPFFVTAAYCATLGLLGLVIGSFLNVVACRVPNGQSILRPPSACPKCGTRIAARDNIPLVGYLLLGGKCRHCRAPIAFRYPLVELATGALWAAAGWRLAQLRLGYWTNIGVGVLWLGFVSAAVVTFLVDYEHMIVLDEISIGGCMIALATSPFVPTGLAGALTGAAAGFGASVLILWLGGIAFKKQIAEARKTDPDMNTALGWGDVKLMAFYGAFLGWYAVPMVFLIASVSGALVGIAVKLRSSSASSALPFAPFLSVAAVAALLVPGLR